MGDDREPGQSRGGQGDDRPPARRVDVTLGERQRRREQQHPEEGRERQFVGGQANVVAQAAERARPRHRPQREQRADRDQRHSDQITDGHETSRGEHRPVGDRDHLRADDGLRSIRRTARHGPRATSGLRWP